MSLDHPSWQVPPSAWRMPIFALAVLTLLLFVLAGCRSERAPTSAPAATIDPLPSWNDTSA